MKHIHSLITIAVMGIASMFGLQLFALLVISGFWIGREHSQAEYRYMKIMKINRSELSFLNSFEPIAWNKDSLINDMILPIFVGSLFIVKDIV